MDQNEEHRAAMDRLRRWEAEQREAQRTQALQRAAAERKRRALAKPAWVSRLGPVLIGLGTIVGAVHVIRHLIAQPRGIEDLAVGYPTAAALALVGLIMLGTR